PSGGRFELLARELPVQTVADDRLQEIRPAILVVEIIRMLPDVDGQQALTPVRHRRIGVRGRLDRELAAVEREPRPAAAELTGRGLHELLLELLHAAERLVDLVGERLARLSPARGEA